MHAKILPKPVKAVYSGITALALILLVFSACAGSPAPRYGSLGKASDPLPFMEKVRRGTLPSGLSYYILENSRPEGRAYLTLAVRAGSALEQDDEQGLAHFTEHMAFNGTARFPEAELVNYLRSLGMRFGPEVNAYTTYDQTVFGIEVPVETDGGGLKTVPARALAVLDDWTRAITFAPADVDEERGVIMEEYRSRLGAMDRFRRKMLPILFEGSPYANRYPIGLPEIIENAPAERLENFYKRWYRADNMAIILVGDFDGAAMEASLASHFTIPKPQTPLDRPVLDLPGPEKGKIRTLIHTDPELTSSRIDLYYKRAPAGSREDIGSYREGVMDNLIERMLNLRFDEERMKPDTSYVGAFGGTVRYGKSARYYVLIAQAKTGSIEAAFTELLRTKESMARYGFTESELALVKSSLLSDLEQMVSEKDRQESQRYVSAFTDHFITGESCPDIEWELEAVRTLLPGIGVRDIAAEVKNYFAAGDLRIFISAPETETIPPETRFADLVKQSAKMNIEKPASDGGTGELLSEAPERGKIVSESTDPETGAVLWTLENGAKVILRETKNRNNEIVFFAAARGGLTSVAGEDLVSANLAAEMAEASGLGPYSRPELIKKIADKQVSLSYWTSDTDRGFRGSSGSGDVKTLFEMLYLGFTQPRIDEEAAAVLLDQYRTVLDRRDDDPNTVFEDEITKTVTSGNKWYKPLEISDLGQADTGKARAFLRRTRNPSDYTFIFVGNINTAEMRGLAETYLASIPRGAEWNSWTDPGIVRPGKITKTVYKGKEEQSLVYLRWYEDAPWSEEASVTAQVLTEYLDIKMTEEIREKLRGVYSVSVSIGMYPAPRGERSMGIYFACDPHRVDELINACIELLQRTASQPIDSDVFAKSIEALRKEWEASIQSNSYIAQSYANSSVLLDTPLSRLDKRPALFGTVRPAAIQEILSGILPKGPARIILYPDSPAQ